MRIVHQHPLADASGITTALWDIPSWTEWVPGLFGLVVEETAEPEVSDVQIDLAGPRPIHLRIAVQRLSDGVGFRLLQGDASSLSGEVRVHADQLHWDIEVVWPINVPQPLLVELRTEVLPRWSRALVMYSACRT